MKSKYSHDQHEPKMYQLWQDNQVFQPDLKADENYTIIMPPPNANDPLHIGHAMFVALEDIFARYQRMQGKAVLWLPGTDHAGIETQFVFEKKLRKQGKSRFDLDRDTLFKQVWDYVQANSDTAVNQIKQLGASADWSRFTFMLDPKVVEQVLLNFQKLYQDKLVYRDLQIVNYCTKCGTSFSDLEVEYVERQTPLYYIRYAIPNSQEYEVIATTRPEPIFVDTHIAVHPENPKTKHLIGKTLINPLTNKPMEVIADEFVDPEFGTGIVKLTPAHDFNDFAVAQTHDLPIIPAIGANGRIVPEAEMFANLTVNQAREAAIKQLEASNKIEKVDTDYTHRVGTCYRCHRVLESLPLPQFFIKVKPLVEPVIKALDSGEVKVHGAGQDKILHHWLSNLRDWNVSRQIVWGIRLPVWYPTDHPLSEQIQVNFIDVDGNHNSGSLGDLLNKHSLEEIKSGLQSLQAPQDIPYQVLPDKPKDDSNLIQETDTFDTWFSSAQWPFTSLIANSKADFKRFYPTQLMETGYDILPFWVMRMLFMGKKLTGQLPFNQIYLHGLIRDPKGQKMSKSKGNVINPLDVVSQYGADALRMALVIRSTPAQDKNVGITDFKSMRNLTNKIWNATRFVLMSLDKDDVKSGKNDKTINQQIGQVTEDITRQLDQHKPGLAAETAYNQFWHWYCDQVIEEHKQGLVSHQVLISGLITWLKLLHPFVPFVTEAAYQEVIVNQQVKKFIQSPNPTLALTDWPKT